LREAHAKFRALGRERLTARSGLALGRVLQARGEGTAAGELFDAALVSARERGSGRETAVALDALAGLAEERGDEATAREHRAAAGELRAAQGGLAQ
jgi:hypothetical protein